MRALLVVLLVSVSACVRVAPWEREHLARPVMQLEDDPDEAVLEQHFLESREGSVGGFGEAGGGCGCN
jgi:hypothetical protein